MLDISVQTASVIPETGHSKHVDEGIVQDTTEEDTAENREEENRKTDKRC